MSERHYGLKHYDKVIYPIMNGEIRGQIISFSATDNNCAFMQRSDNNKIISVICEWCKVIENC